MQLYVRSIWCRFTKHVSAALSRVKSACECESAVCVCVTPIGITRGDLTGHRTRGDNANLVTALADLSHWIVMPVSVGYFIRRQDGTNGLYCGHGDVYICEMRCFDGILTH